MPSRTPILIGTIPTDLGVIHDLAAVEVDGDHVFVCATGHGTIWSWRPSSDTWREHAFELPAGWEAMAAENGCTWENEFDQVAAVVHDGRIIVGAGDDEQPPSLWDLETGRLVTGYPVDAAYSGAIAAIGGASPRIVTGLQYCGDVCSWDPSGRTSPVEFPDDVSDVKCLAVAHVGDRTLLAIGAEGVIIRDLSTREQVAHLDTDAGFDYEEEDADGADFDEDADDRIFAVSIGRLDGRPVVLGGSAEPGKIFVWDVTTGDQLIRPLTGHDGFVNAIASTDVDGRLIAATGCDDGTVRLWDINARNQIGDPLTDHDGPVEAVLPTTLADRQALVTAGRDGVIRIWDLAALLD